MTSTKGKGELSVVCLLAVVAAAFMVLHLVVPDSARAHATVVAPFDACESTFSEDCD